MSDDRGSMIPKTKTSMALAALLLVSLGAGAALLFDRWDEISNEVLTKLHIKHFRRAAMLKQRTTPVTITGEVVDAWCYASQTMGPGRGPGHLSCALACINGGVSAGILEDETKTLYVAAKYRGYRGCRELLMPYIGQRVTVTGLVGDQGGGNILKIYTVKPVEPSAGKAPALPAGAIENESSQVERNKISPPGDEPAAAPGTAGDTAATGQATKDDCTECAK